MHKPIRGERNELYIHAPGDLHGHLVLQDDVQHFVGDHGDIQTYRSKRIAALHCGCFAEPKGCCSICKQKMCNEHFFHCMYCHRPIGICHASRRRPVCTRCRLEDEVRETVICIGRAGRFMGKALLLPFIEFEKK